jgi:hypothetical protein
MKKLILLSISTINYSLIGWNQGVPVGNPPGTSAPSSLASSAWYRGGNVNSGTAVNNNILGTFFDSEIFIFTNSTKLAAFTRGNYLTSLTGNYGNGLRIFNPFPNNTGGNLDLFTSGTAGQNETHIVFGGNGQISGQASRLETYGDWEGLYFNSLNPSIGKIKFARNGIIQAMIGTNNFLRIGEQQNSTNANANRRLEVVDYSWQLRLTNGNESGGFYSDFMTNSSGNLQILAQNGKVGINATTNPTATLDVFGDLRVRNIPTESPDALIVGVNNSNANDLSMRKLAFTGDTNNVLLGDGTWGTLPAIPAAMTANNGCSISLNNVQLGETYNAAQTSPLQNNREIALNSKNLIFSGIGKIGVGLNFPDLPTERIDIAGNARVRNLPTNQQLADNTINKVVVVDDSGVLKWKPIDSVGANITTQNGIYKTSGDTLEWGTQPLSHHTALPMNGKNIFFTPDANNATLTNNIKIGSDTIALPHKLSIVNTIENNAVFAISNSTNFSTNTRSGLIAKAENATVPIGVIAKATNGEQTIGTASYATNGTLSTTGIYSHANSSSNTGDVYGGKFIGQSPTINTNYGIHATAQNATKTNIGGYFKSEGGTTSIGIYVEANSSIVGAEKWAGYFAGPIISGAPSIPSDIQFKTNIEPIINPLTIISNLNPVTYNYLQTGNAAQLNFPSNLQYGLIAQEVEQILPEIVTTVEHPAQSDSLGTLINPAFQYKSLNYEAFIPLLISGMQQQQNRIDSLENINFTTNQNNDSLINLVNDLNSRLTELENCLSNILPALCQANQAAIFQHQDVENPVFSNQILHLKPNDNIYLAQNIPNPFSETTSISYFIPENVQSAEIQFYNVWGDLVDNFTISDKGNGTLTVHANELAAGSYTYVLLIDGKIYAERKMVKF